MRDQFRTLGFLTTACSLVLGACGGGSQDEFIAGAGDLGHIHDLALGDDGVLLVASHSGLYRIEDERTAVRIGVAHDLMSMTVLPDGDILASGHPNLLLEESASPRPDPCGRRRTPKVRGSRSLQAQPTSRPSTSTISGPGG